MLPSKGYFRSIDCPFYMNDLCHRFYCHFRHIRKENVFTSNLELIDTSNCEDDYPITSKDTLTEISITTEDTGIDQTKLSDKIEEPDFNTELANKNKIYSIPINTPKYNPTPISELKRHKLISSNIDSYTDNSDNCNQLHRADVNKDSSIIETLVEYFVKDKITTVVDDNNAIDENKNTIDTETEKTNISQISNGTKVVQNSDENILPIPNINSIVQEDVKLKEMINQLQTTDTDSETKNEKEIMDNKTLLEDLMGCSGSPFISSKDTLEKRKIENSATDIEVIKDRNHVNSKKSSLRKRENSFKVLVREHSCEKQNISTISDKSYERGIYNHNIKPPNKQFNQIKNSSKTISNVKCFNTILEENNDVGCEQSLSNDTYDPEVIFISDSEDVDDCINHDDTTVDKLDEYNTEQSKDNFPEPKRKIRISRVSNQNQKPVKYERNPYYQKIYDKLSINDETNYPASNQKMRSAHKINYSTLSLQSIDDHLSHWQKVKDRVKNKCINPTGEEGYQNWAKVRISPVPNVSSLINSKKLLFSNIQKWKSKTNI